MLNVMRKFIFPKLTILLATIVSLQLAACGGGGGGGGGSGSSSNWPAKVGVTSKDRALAMAPDSQGNVYVTGYTVGAFPGYTNAGGKDMYVLKVDPNGNVLWTRQIGTSGRDVGLGIVAGSNGSVYVSGYSANDISAVARHKEGHYNGFLMKINGSTGAVEKTAMYGDNPAEYAVFFSLAMGQNGALCVSGEIISASGSAGLVACYNENLDLTADRRVDGSGLCTAVAIADNGNVAVACAVRNTSTTSLSVNLNEFLALSGDLEALIFKVFFTDILTAFNQLFWYGNSIVGVAKTDIGIANTETGESVIIAAPDGTYSMAAAKSGDSLTVVAQEKPKSGEKTKASVWGVSEVMGAWAFTRPAKKLGEIAVRIGDALVPEGGSMQSLDDSLILTNPTEEAPESVVPWLTPIAVIA